MSLQGIVLFVFVGISMLFAAAAAGLSAVFLAVLARFQRMRQRPPNCRAAFVQMVVRGLSNNAFQNIGDLHHAYRVHFGTGPLRASHLQELNEFMQSAMRQIRVAPPEFPDSRLPESVKHLRELRAANDRALEVERMCAPFSGTPELEREILEDLLELPVEEKTKFTAKLDALAKAVRFRQDTLERLDEEGGRSLKLARWGWYGTLTLAILVGILGFLCLGL